LNEAELEDVLDEFLRFFRFAVQADGMTREAEHASTEHEAARQRPGTAREAEKKPEPKPFVPTGDAQLDLQQLEPFQIAGALVGESPRTAALVLNCLPTAQAGLTLQLLPEDVRATAFLILRDPPKTPAVVLERILRTTVQKGCRLDASAVADPADEANRKMAELLRAMNQTQRRQLMGLLAAQDPKIAEQLKKVLYTFADLLALSSRSVQKVLSEIDTASLAVALRDADPVVSDKIMENLSKRARLTLNEEIGLLGRVKPADQEAARQTICQIMARLDETGDLEMESP
jgi:flagellar motor switch protein FliG